jgi:hypothetical protein
LYWSFVEYSCRNENQIPRHPNHQCTLTELRL